MTSSVHFLNLAARLALRAQGDVEPNPLVGAVIVKDGVIIGFGHHKRFGGLHAEAEALADCRGRGLDPRGSTLYVTLEPCNHYGKQPPCSKAVIEAGIARVVCARRDPNPISTGGAAALEHAGIPIEFTDVSPLATHISDPFVKRITTGVPWIIAKWAETGDGRLITRPDEPRWISNDCSRRRVHRLRARVDAIIVGIGSVLADDPMLTARGIARLRRVAQRIVIDSRLETPLNSALVRTARTTPVLICTTPDTLKSKPDIAAALSLSGAQVVSITGPHRDRVDLKSLFKHLANLGVATVLIEPGPRLLQSLISERLADELLIHVAPPARLQPPTFPGYELLRSRPNAGDLELHLRRVP